MMKHFKGFLIGFALSTCLAALLGSWYGSWREKLGVLRGHKDGNIEVINFLAKHFPKPNGETFSPGQEFGLKWYSIIVVESNGVKTLKIKNEM
jgi:hypothetical protein